MASRTMHARSTHASRWARLKSDNGEAAGPSRASRPSSVRTAMQRSGQACCWSKNARLTLVWEGTPDGGVKGIPKNLLDTGLGKRHQLK